MYSRFVKCKKIPPDTSMGWWRGNQHRTGSSMIKKQMWGRTTVYLQLFGVNISSMVTYFELQIRLGIRHRLIRLDSIAPPQGICIPQPAHDRLVRVTHRKDYKPFQILKNVKDQLFYLIEFCSQIYASIILYIYLFVKYLFYLFVFYLLVINLLVFG